MFSKALNGATIVDVRGTTTDKSISKTFNGAAKAASTDKIIVVLPTWEPVTELQPRMDDISKCPGKLIIVTAAAPEGSDYDFCSRIFAPKLGVDEDSVCGSAHCELSSPEGSSYDFVSRVFGSRIGVDKSPVCGSANCALAHYWSLKVNKFDFVAYAASPKEWKTDDSF